MIAEFFDPDFMKFFIPLVGAVFAWVYNEFSKQRAEQYLRKEDRYRELMTSLKGYYVSDEYQAQAGQRQNFIDQLELCWLYCPDDVIRKGYVFLDIVRASSDSSFADKEKALQEFVLSIRVDLMVPYWKTPGKWRIWGTSLEPEDFKMMTIT